MRRRQRIDAPFARDPLNVGQLAFVHPLRDEIRVHAVEPEDQKLLRELPGGGAARAGRMAGEDECRAREEGQKTLEHRVTDYSNGEPVRLRLSVTRRRHATAWRRSEARRVVRLVC